jgi:hypothetical protein
MPCTVSSLEKETDGHDGDDQCQGNGTYDHPILIIVNLVGAHRSFQLGLFRLLTFTSEVPAIYYQSERAQMDIARTILNET